jgi:tRNA pseudouridine55 synthase
MHKDTPSNLISGLLNLNKPTGVTSRDVVNGVTRLIRRIKVGHAGTLDPLASGVLVLCVGSATRLIEYVQRMPKTYRTTIRLGATSDTLDADGQVVEHPIPVIPDEATIREVLKTQVGTISQVPPQFSALKVAGQRAYDLARAGQTVELAAREVAIDRVELLSYDWPRLELEIDCGGGTYIRSIARDVGEALGCGGLVEILIRTRIGPFTLEGADEPADLNSPLDIERRLRPPVEALGEMPRMTIDENERADIVQGRSLSRTGTPMGEIALLLEDGSLLAIAEADPETGKVAPRRVLT